MMSSGAEEAGAAADQLRQTSCSTSRHLQFVSGQLVSGPPVKGAPYSAEAVNETIQTLADGNRIVQRTSAMQYRDSEGRERREETSAMGAIFITDPVAGTRYTLHPDSRTAEKGPMPRLRSVARLLACFERGVSVTGRSMAEFGARPAQQRSYGMPWSRLERHEDRTARQHVHRRRPGPGDANHDHDSRGRHRQ